MRKSVKISVIIISAIFGLIVAAVGAFFIVIEPSIGIFGLSVPDLDKLSSHSRTVTLIDAYGNPIDDALCAGNNVSIRIDDLHDYTINAFIAIEDKRFYNHGGIDYRRMASALFSNITHGEFREGASTITQQLIKNTHLSGEKTIKRKLNEIRLARALERIYDKRQILESYFNILYFGSGIRGLGTASRIMFGKSASELSIAQSAALASIINNPTKYCPYNNFDNLTMRKESVLSLMLEQGYINDVDYKSALAEQLEFSQNKRIQFVTGAIIETCKKLNRSEKMLYIDNCTLKTAYEPKISDAVRAALKNIDGNYSARIVVLNNATGGIACDETNRSRYLNLRRSPASAIKPFVSYAAALKNGMNPLSQILDEPTDFGGYSPHNYKDVYHGYISLNDSLIYSSNIAAVKLLKQIGVEQAKQTASAFGLKFEREDNSLAIALGGMKKGVTLVELANAYRTIANGGVYSNVHYVSSVFDGISTTNLADSKTIRVVDDDVAYLLTDMLIDCTKRGTAKKLKYCGNIAAKTGTNGDESGNIDCYCVAFTPEYTIAVWYGAETESIPNNITGASCCDIIKLLVQGDVISTEHTFKMPQSVSYYEIDGQELETTHEVYLADPLLPKRYRYKTLLSKRNLPVRKDADIMDYYEEIMWGDDE